MTAIVRAGLVSVHVRVMFIEDQIERCTLSWMSIVTHPHTCAPLHTRCRAHTNVSAQDVSTPARVMRVLAEQSASKKMCS